MTKKPEKQDGAAQSVERKSAYTSPQLTRFGAVQGLTLGSGGSKGDGRLGHTRGGSGMDMTPPSARPIK